MSKVHIPYEDTHVAFIAAILGQQIQAIKNIRGSDGFGHAVEVGNRVWYVSYSPMDGSEGTMEFRRLVGISEITYPLPKLVDMEFRIQYNLKGGVNEDV